jgi:small-conductance mechanosensitive channel
VLRTIGIGIRASIPILVISIITNIAGNIALAELLVWALLATVYLAFLFFAGENVLDAALTVALRTHVVRKLRMVRNHGELILNRGRLWIHVSMAFLWLNFSAHAFQVRRPIVDGLRAFFTADLEVGTLALSLWDFILFGLMIWLSVWISRWVRFFLEEDVLSRASLPRGVPFAISTMARYVVLLIGFFVAVAAAGFDMSRFALLAGALGVGIGIGLQDVVNNFVSGLILLFERPIQLGDIVEVGTLRGNVRRIGMRSSTVHTFDGAEVIVPNSQFVSKEFVNWTLSNRQRRINVFIGVAYGTDPTRVLEILSKIAQDNDDILNYPEPQALFVGFGDSSLDFELRAWTDRFDGWRQVQSDMSVSISTALREAEIQIPFPQRDLHLRTVSPEAREHIQPEGVEATAKKPPTT